MRQTDATDGIFFPESLIEKCLRLEAPGGELDRVMITIPTVVQPGRAFAATVSILDENAMPLVGPEQRVSLCSGSAQAREIIFPAGRSSVARIANLVVDAPGVFRLNADIDGRSFVSNPALCTSENRPRVLWGDPHIHTTLGDCHAERCRTRNLAYAIARHAYGLDFIALSDHISWAPRGTPGKWYDNLAACELYNEPGEFSALYCYETSMRGGRGGDCNIYLRQPNRTYVDPWPDDLNAASLCEQIDGEFFAVPHHTTRTKKHGEIPREAYPGEALMPVVEIHSKWGSSEFRGNPTPLVNMHTGPSYVQDLLAQGYRLGFVGGTDSHTSMTFCVPLESEIHQSPPGLTAVMVDTNSREAIYSAIADRRCYAACGERILLDVQCGGLDMGSVGDVPAAGEITIDASYAAESDISCVEVIRNNVVVHREQVGTWKGAFSWSDAAIHDATPISDATSGEPNVFYYVRVTAQAHARAWSSPCWFRVAPGQ